MEQAQTRMKDAPSPGAPRRPSVAPARIEPYDKRYVSLRLILRSAHALRARVSKEEAAPARASWFETRRTECGAPHHEVQETRSWIRLIGTRCSVADLTFLPALPRVIRRNVKSKATLESNSC